MQYAILISKEDKVTSKRDVSYQVLERINNNAYKINLPEEFSVHSTLNVADLSSFDVSDDFSDSRTNSFEEGKNDKDHGVPNVPTRPMTRSKAKKIQQAFIG